MSTICWARRAMVLCRFPRASFTAGGVVKTLKNGSAHRSFVHGGVTTKALVIQRHPLLRALRSLTSKEAIAVVPTLVNLASRGSLQGFINHDVSRPSSSKGTHQYLQQSSAHFLGRPASTVKHLMEVTEVSVALLSHLTQCRRDGSTSAGKSRCLQGASALFSMSVQ